MTTRCSRSCSAWSRLLAILAAEGFKVLPYTTEDLSAAERLVGAGCTVLMPWAAPIGSARGLINREGLKTLRAYFPDTTLIVDAGIGAPSHAAEAMELGYDAVLLNTAVAKAGDPVKMAPAFARAIEAGRLGFEAGLIEPRDMASPRRLSPARPSSRKLSFSARPRLSYKTTSISLTADQGLTRFSQNVPLHPSNRRPLCKRRRGRLNSVAPLAWATTEGYFRSRWSPVFCGAGPPRWAQGPR